MAWMPGALRKVIPSSNYSASSAPSIGAVVHVIVGSADSAIAEFQTPGSQLSAHFVVTGPGDPYPDGTIFQMLDSTFCAYAQAAGNYPPTKYTAIETSGQPDVPMSAAQEAAVAAIVAWDANAQGYPLTGPVAHGQRGVTSHCNPDGSPDPAWGNHSCPGGPRLAQIPAIIALAKGTPSTGSTIQEDDMPVIYPPNAGVPNLESEVTIPTPPGKAGTVWLSCDYQPQTVRCFVGVGGAMRPYGAGADGIVGVPPGRKIGIPFAPTDEMVSLVHVGPNIPKGQPHPVSALVVTN